MGEPHVGRARVGRAVGVARTPDRAPTAMFEVDTTAPPVFVDASGGRRRRVRWLAYVVGVVVLIALLVMVASQLGGTVRPQPVTPCTPKASAPAAQPGGGCARR